MTTTHTSGAADLPEALRHANTLDTWAIDLPLAGKIAAELRRLHALTAQAISAEPAGAGYAALPKPAGRITVEDYPGGLSYGPTYEEVDAFTYGQMRLWADDTHTLRAEALAAAYREELDKLSQRNYELRTASHGQAPAQPVDFTTLGAAMRAIQQTIGLIGDPADERMQAVRRVLRGAVVVAEDSGDIPAQPDCLTCNDHGAVGNILTAEPCPDCTPTPQAADTGAAWGDDVAVDMLSGRMKGKLAKQRAKGYGGWDSTECTQQHLSNLLRAHVDKGDPVDVANFCAFLSARGEGIVAPAQGAGITAVSGVMEYIGNGMFKGETIQKAAEHWANWCDRRMLDGLSEFLRVVAAAPQPEPPACTRSHPHVNMTWQCQIRTVTAEMHNMEARGQEATEHTLGAFADALDAALLDATAPPADSVMEDAARLKVAVGLLEELAEHDSYSTEYDGRMVSICPECGEQEGEHRPNCAFVRAKAYLAARKQGGA